MPEGIDVYQKYQQVTDWKRVRAADIQFAYVKLSDGVNTRNDGGYVAGGRAAGVKMGGYHYAQPGDPIAQANLLVSRCAATGAVDLAPALDLEAPFVPGLAARDFAIKFLKQVKARGHRPCIYGNNSMLSDVLPAVRAQVPDVVVWCARYGGTPTVGYDVHQYADNGSVPGIIGSVDRNRGRVPYNVGAVSPPSPTPPVTQTNEDELMERKTVGSSSATTSVRVMLSGTDGARIVVRPRLDAAGNAAAVVWLGNIYAWGDNADGSGKTGVGGNPYTGQPGTIKLQAHKTYHLPGALWADVEYSSTQPFEIDCF
jgi:lysozyme